MSRKTKESKQRISTEFDILDEAYWDGRRAFYLDRPIDSNPYSLPDKKAERRQWYDGYLDGRERKVMERYGLGIRKDPFNEI